jgi:hypothetical protein
VLLPPRPDSDDEDNAPALPLTSGNYTEEAMVIELTALVVACPLPRVEAPVTIPGPNFGQIRRAA